MFRLALMNHYDPPNLLVRIALDKVRASMVARRRLSLPDDIDILARVSALSGIPVPHLYPATAHTFAGLLTPPGTKIDVLALEPGLAVEVLKSGIADKQLRSESAAQFCPRCIARSAHFPLMWMPVAVSACTHHKCIFVNRCPSCTKRLSILEIVRCTCRRCGHDLRDTPTGSVVGDELGLSVQRTLQRWLSDPASPADPTSLGLPKQPPRVLYRVADGLRQSLQTRAVLPILHSLPGTNHSIAMRKRLNRRRLTPGESYILYTTAMAALCDWPDGFHRLLDALVSRSSSEGCKAVKPALGVLHSNWLEGEWAHPCYQFVQEAYDEFLRRSPIPTSSLAQLDRYREDPVRHDGSRFISLSDAARELGTSTGAVSRLANDGRLRQAADPAGGARPTPTLLYLRDVELLGRRWASTIPLSTAMERLGLNRATVLGLGALGLLDVVRGPRVDGYRMWRLDEPSVAAFHEQICKSINRRQSSPDAIGLTRAAHIAANVGCSAAEILSCVAHGKIDAFFDGDREPFRLGKFAFSIDDIRSLCARVEAENGWVRKGAIMRRMRVSRKVVDTWIRRDLLPPSAVHNNICYFDATDVERFCQAHVRLVEAALYLGVSAQTAWKWTKRGRLRPVSGPGVDGCKEFLFRRDDITDLAPENRLTTPQAAETIGISASQLLVWIHDGRVRPLSGPGIDETGHYLFSRADIHELAAKRMRS